MKLGMGCHIECVFLGAAGFADYVILLAPSRSAMQLMLNVCQYSTDLDPDLSKTKCLFMCGKSTNVTYPAPVQLNGHYLFLGEDSHTFWL